MKRNLKIGLLAFVLLISQVNVNAAPLSVITLNTLNISSLMLIIESYFQDSTTKPIEANQNLNGGGGPDHCPIRPCTMGGDPDTR